MLDGADAEAEADADAEADARTGAETGAGTGAGTDAGTVAGTGAGTGTETGAVGASCSNCAVVVTGAMVAASALALSSANSLARSSVLIIFRRTNPGRWTSSTASSSSKVRLRETITKIL